MKKNPNLILAMSVFIFCFGCKSRPDSAASDSTKAPEITLTPFSNSVDYPDAAISSMDYKSGEFTFGIQGNYKLGEQTPDAPQKMCANSSQGQHIHLILDNKPYEAKYQSNFHYKIDDGEHYLLAFLSRSYHESLKNPSAYALAKATIQDSSFKKMDPVSQPMLFYSRPKGNYVGADTKKVMLDFYVVNCNLGNKYKVKANVNDKEFMIDKWQPYYLEGLPMGDNKIKLTLVDSAGVAVNCPLNPVERTFKLQAEPGQK